MRLFEHASAGETLMNAFIVMVITFAALMVLYLLIRVFSFVFSNFKHKKPPAENMAGNEKSELTDVQYSGEFSTGMLVLKNVSQSTAAMIMAIVSDEAGIPLERLIFRSIKLVKEEIQDDI